MSDDLLAAALNYLDIGLAIVPVAGDQPLVPWEQYLTRLPKAAELHTMFALHKSSVTGIATVLGPATWATQPHLCVLRISRADRPRAKTWLDATLPGWEESRIAESGTGALHVYVLASEPVETESHGLITLLGNRCVQLMPPSLVGAAGKRIEWVSEGQPLNLDMTSVVFPRAQSVQNGVTGARNGKQPAPAASSPKTPPQPGTSQKRNGHTPPEELQSRPRMTIHARGLLPASGVPPSFSAPASASAPPVTAPTSALPTTTAVPATQGVMPASPALIAAANALQRAGLNTRTIIAALSAVNRVQPESRSTLSTIRKLAATPRQSAPLASGTRQSSPLGEQYMAPAVAIEPVYFAREGEPSSVDYLVEGVLTTGLTLFYGEIGATKSLLATALGLCVASGKPFLGMRAQQLPVAYIDHDLGRRAMHSRVLGVARGLGINGGVPADFAYFDATSASLDRVRASVLTWLGAHPGALLIVDSLEASAGSKDEQAVRKTIGLIRDLLEHAGSANGSVGGARACIAVDHLEHGKEHEPRPSITYGHTRAYSAANSLIHVDVVTSSPTSRSICITQTKNTLGTPASPVKYHVVFDPASDEIGFRPFSLGRTSRESKSA